MYVLIALLSKFPRCLCDLTVPTLYCAVLSSLLPRAHRQVVWVTDAVCADTQSVVQYGLKPAGLANGPGAFAMSAREFVCVCVC